MKKVYHRAHLRSPVNRSLFYVDHKKTNIGVLRNISAGGLSFTQKDFVPEVVDISFLTCVPQTPHLKNFDEVQLFEYQPELFPSIIIRAIGRIVRKFEEEVYPDQVCFGVQFTEIDDHDQRVIESFAEKAASNVSYLHAMLDSSEDTDKIYKIAEILGYSRDISINDLKEIVLRDLMSLKWT